AFFDAAAHNVAVPDQIANHYRFLVGHKAAAPLLGDEDEVLATNAVHRDDWNRNRRFIAPDNARAHVLLDSDARRSCAEGCLDKDGLGNVVGPWCNEGNRIARDDIAAGIEQFDRKTRTQTRRALERHVDIGFQTFWRVDRRDQRRRRNTVALAD